MKLKWYIKDWNSISKEDFYKCCAKRIEIFVVEQDCPYQDLDGKDQESYHVYAKNANDQVMAYARIVKKGVSYEEISVGRVIVNKEARGVKLGAELMNRCHDFIKQELNEGEIRLSAQQYLLKFYSDLGYKSTGKEYLEDGIPHVEMIKIF